MTVFAVLAALGARGYLVACNFPTLPGT
jgi:hypothetical protein